MPLWKIILGVYIGGVIAFTAHAHFFDEYYRHLGLIPNLGRGLLWFVFCLPLIGKTVALIVSLRPLQNSPKSPKFPLRHLGNFS